MEHRPRRGAKPFAGKPSIPDTVQSTAHASGRLCPRCQSRDTVFVQRGLTTASVSKDQYVRCNNCDQLTYEIVSRTDREIRIGRHQVGGEFHDSVYQTSYSIYRMLKVGFNEYLLYLRPILPGAEQPQ